MKTHRRLTIVLAFAGVLDGTALAAGPATPSIDRAGSLTKPVKPLLSNENKGNLRKRAETGPGLAPNVRAAGCPDPAAVQLDYRIDDRHLRYRINYTVTGTIQNQGIVPFQSGPGQQEIHLIEREPGKQDRVVLTRGFQNLRPGEEVGINYSTYMNTGIGTHPVAREYHLKIVYDLDIRNDGNPRNDDCKSNNSTWIRLDPRHFSHELLRVP